MNMVHGECIEDVQGLKVFLAVAEYLSFTRAAEALFLTQSAVSHQIARLEKSLGASLFSRRGRSVTLTPAGKVLVNESRRVFAALAGVVDAVKLANNPDLGQLRVGASASACQYLIPEAMREFRESYPSVTLSIIPGDSPDVLNNLVNDQIDLGVLIRLERRGKIEFHDLFHDELGFLVSPLHPWARAGKVDRKQIANQRLILYSRRSATFHLAERYFLRMGMPIQQFIELGSMGAINELVKLGLGVSVVARWTAMNELREKSLVWLPLPGIKLKRTWSIAWKSGRTLDVAEQTFVGLCEFAAARLGET